MIIRDKLGRFVKGYTKQLSEETKRKISKALKEKYRKGERKPVRFMLGKHWSEEVKKKISKANKGRISWIKGKHHSEETKRKISEALKGEKHPLWGRKLSIETRKRYSELVRKQWAEGKRKKGWKISEEAKRKISQALKGRKLSQETKRKISEANKGEKHYNWQGGKSFEPYTVDWTETLKRAIRERDKYICQLCHSYGNVVHHIDYDKKNCNSDNLVTLCRTCHNKTNYNRKFWKSYFQKWVEKEKEEL